MNHIVNSHGKVEIEEQEYIHLIKDQKKLQVLEAYGVDNWDGYYYAMEELEKEKVNKPESS